MPDRPPRGRDEVVAALLDAAEELFARQGPASVSVRDLAAVAGVNHGLVHRHFGSKEALLGAVLDRQAERIARDLRGAGAGGGSLADQAGALEPYWRLLARAILDGEDPRHLQGDFPTVRYLVERFEERGLEQREARLAAAELAARTLGWLLFESFLVPAAGLEGEDRAGLRREVLGRRATTRRG